MLSRHPEHVTLLGRTNFRDRRRVFGIRKSDRLSHVYVVGKTGTGKSTLLETMIRQDIEHGHGVAVLDPHGDLAERLVINFPEDRRDDLIYFNVPDSSRPLAFNPLHGVSPPRRPVVAAAIVDAFEKIWPDSWGPRTEHLLRHIFLTLLDLPQATLADGLRLLDDKTYRTRAAGRVANPDVRRFWLREFEGYPARLKAEASAPVQNKLGAFLTDPRLSRILGQPRNSVDLRQIMDSRRVLIANLSKGQIGQQSAALLGSFLVAQVGAAALARADSPQDARPFFAFYLDEFQLFSSKALASWLAELRKFRVALVAANQFLGQLDSELRLSVLGNVGTIVCFRLGVADATLLAQEFHPEFSASDLISLPRFGIYLRLQIDGAVTSPFSADVIPPNQQRPEGGSAE